MVYTNQLPGSVVENDRQRRPLGSGIILHEEALVLPYVYIYHVIHVCMYIYNYYVYIYIYHIQIHLGGLLPASETEFRSSKFYPLPIINSTSPSNFFSFPPTPQTPHSSPRCHHRSIHHEAQELLLQGLLRRPLQIPIAGWQRHVAAPSTG